MDKVLLRNSERTEYKRCRWRWDLHYNHRWTPVQSKPALRFGDLVHQALAEFYRPGVERGPHPAETFDRLYEEDADALGDFGFTADDEWEEAKDLGLAMLDHYIDVYGQDPDMEVIAPEMPFQVDIYNPKNGRYLVTMVGSLDLVVRWRPTGKIGLVDHKTAKAIQTAHLGLDEQAGAYWAFAGEFLRQQGYLEDGEEIDFILYNFLRKAKPDPRPEDERGRKLNKDGSVSKSQPPPYFHREAVYRSETDRQNLINRVRAEAWEMAKVREGKLPLIKNPTQDCHWDCPMFDVCELHETGADWEEMLSVAYTTWDPYAAHRESLEE